MESRKIIFKDMNGNEMTDFQYELDSVDHTLFDSDANVGGVEFAGRRGSNEDKVVTHQYKNLHLSQFSNDEMTKILSSTTATLKTCIDSFKFSANSGTTFCGVVQEGLDYYVVNLGDSTAFKGILTNNESKFELLNEIHNPTFNLKERARVEKAGGKIKHNEFYDVHRLSFDSGSIAVSGSLGDTKYKYYGFRYNPDIVQGRIDLQDNQEGFLLVACDGLTETTYVAPNHIPVLDAEKIGLLIQENKHLPLDELAKVLAEAAFKGNGKVVSNDNISVLVKRFEKILSGINLLAVFDGHGGKDVSQLASMLLVSTMHIFMQRVLLEQKMKQLSEANNELANQLASLLSLQLTYLNDIGLIARLARKIPQPTQEVVLFCDNNDVLASLPKADVVSTKPINREKDSFPILKNFFEGQATLLTVLLETPEESLAERVGQATEFLKSDLLLKLFLNSAGNISTDQENRYRDICQLAQMVSLISREYDAKVSLSFSHPYERFNESLRDDVISKMIAILEEGIRENESADEIMEDFQMQREIFLNRNKTDFTNSNNNSTLLSTSSSGLHKPLNLNQHLISCIDKVFSTWKPSHQLKLVS